MKKMFFSTMTYIRKLHPIDVVGIVMFVSVVLFSFFFLLRESRYVYVTLRLVYAEDIAPTNNMYPDWYVEKLQTGLNQKDLFGNTKIEVINLDTYQSNSNIVEAFVTVRIQSTFSQRKQSYNFEGKDLLIGDYTTFKIAHFLLKGTIYDVSEELKTYPKQKFLVTGIIDPVWNGEYLKQYQMLPVLGVQNYFADRIHPNLVVKNNMEHTVFAVQTLTKKSGMREEIINGRLELIPDSGRTQVTIEAELEAEQIGRNFYFTKIHLLAIGRSIFVPADEVPFWLLITDIKKI